MNFQDYKNSKRELFVDFARIVCDVLHAAIAESGLSLHLQQIQFRAKAIDSLEKKLADRSLNQTDNIENIIKDLAGCRVIFYYNDDVNSFINSGIIRDNFSVYWDESNIHYPKGKSDSANDLYIANHYVVELNDSRTSLPEYSKFKGMRCEIQIHTVLNQAWSETAHDIIYKKPAVDGFGSRIFEAIDKRLQKVMTEYLRPAGYEFQKIQRDYQRLLAGKDLFDRNIIQDIAAGIDNNQCFKLLERYSEYTLPHYDDFSKEIDDILKLVKTAFTVSRKNPIVPIDTPFGSFPGKTSLDILQQCTDILTFVRYVDIEAVFQVLVELYSQANTVEEKELIVKAIKKLSDYDLDIMSRVGIHVQFTLIDILSAWDENTLAALGKLAMTICNSALNSTAEGISSTYKTVTIRRGNLIGNDALEKMRLDALNILKRIYSFSDAPAEKKSIIQVFNNAARQPYQGNYSDNLLEIILRNSVIIVDFYTSIIPDEAYDILESIEEDVLFLYRRSKGIKMASEAVKKQNELLLERISDFRDRLNADAKFIVYKTLVGFESVFPDEWGDNKWGFQQKNDYRKSKIAEYAGSVNAVSERFWEEIILKCAQTKSDDLATFPLFGEFLNKLAQTRPDFLFSLLKEHDTVLLPFATSIIDGLLKGSSRDRAIQLMNSWIDRSKNLFYCARVCAFNGDVIESLLPKIFNKAKEHEDVAALNQVIGAVAANYDADNKHLIPDIFLPVIEELTKLESTGWVNDFWYSDKRNVILSELDEAGTGVVLKNLLLLDSVDYHAEEILAPIAERWPNKVVNYFGDRLKTNKDDSEPFIRYEAIPYEFHHLSEPLSVNPDDAVDIAMSWYDGDHHLYVYQGARLLKNIFPGFPEPFKACLLKLIQSGAENNLKIVLAILKNYEGEPFLHDVCKELVLALPEDSDLLAELEMLLQSSGVVSGEFGIAETYERKKQEVEGWLTDPSNKIKKFAVRYISHLDKQILSERKRVEQEIELRRHQFGDEESAS